MIKLMAGAALAAGALLMGAANRTPQTRPQLDSRPYPGQLTILDKQGRAGALCPLERTSVNAKIAGFGAEVSVVQTFVNTSKEPIEAVYTFPLPNDAAVHRMRMRIGERIIEGAVKRRGEARQIYDAAKAAGQSAALLDQERPNIFTQSVANIVPGARVQIEISYVQLLKYDSGQFEFSFPMVVGPRFLGNAPDPSKIDPPRATRVGTNIDLAVEIDAGTTISNVDSVLHDIDTTGLAGNRVRVALKNADEIPNRDFMLRYRAVGQQPKAAFVTHADQRGGFFTLIVMPPQRPVASQIMPREVVFVMDQSGSQSGFPIEKSKELTLKMIDQLRPGDTFNVIGFNNAVKTLWSEPRSNTEENMVQARAFIGAMQANGGTQLREGVVAALQGQHDPARLRIVLFNTDGYVGDEAMVLDTIQKQRESARMFTFGIGNSVNRFLIDSMAEEGRGMAEYVTLAEAADKAVAGFVKRTQTPVLTDLTASFSGVAVNDVQPKYLPDVFDNRPVVLYGRFTGAGRGQVTLSGKLGGQPWSQTLDLDFSAKPTAAAVPVLWARKKIAEIERTDYLAGLKGQQRNAQSVETRVTDLALQFGLMSQYTSFVAVESRVVNVGGKQRTVAVPVEQADGVSMGQERVMTLGKTINGAPAIAPASSGLYRGGAGGAGGGFGGGGAGGGGFSGGGLSGGQGLIPTKSEADKGVALRTAPSKETPEQRRQRLYTLKVSQKLRSAKGMVDVQVWVAKLDPDTLAKLVKAGLKVAESDKGLKIVFGTIDASQLKSLADLDAVQKIDPL